MKRTQRRGQAALEFLTTYGWAFLVILVMIGALAYFGVINPNRFLPERCQLQTEFHCKDFFIDSTNGEILMMIQNNLGSGVTIAADELMINTTNGPGTTCGGPYTLGAGQTVEVTCTFGSGSLPSDVDIVGEKVKFRISGQYSVTSGRYPRLLSGEIFGTVQES